MAHQAAEALVPVLVGVVIDRAVVTGDGGALLGSLALLAGLFAVLSTAFRLGYRLVARAEQAAAHALRVALARRVLDPAGGADAGRLPGALLSIATADAGRVGAVNVAVAMGAGVLAAVAVAAAVLLQISVTLGLLVVLGLPPLLYAVNVLGRPLARRSADEQDNAGRAAGVATDLVAGLRVLKGLGAEDAAVDRYRRASRDSLQATLRAARAEAAYEGATIVLTGAFLVLVALVAGRLAAQGRISVGELVAAVGLTQFLIGPLTRVSWVGAELARARASGERVGAVLGAPLAVTGGAGSVPASTPGGLRLRGVTHAGLHELALELAPGDFVGIVATDPADATALLECLARDADPRYGAIELDGQPLTALAVEHVRRAVLVAAHDSELFDGTLAENVAAAARDPQRVEPALVAAAADEVAAALPEGRDTRVAARGSSLSGGQRQRVALARALAADPVVLVLHDPTTAVDAATEARIAEAVRDVRRGRTTIVLTSSPALLAASDRVVVIEGGAVTAAGQHSELLGSHSGYREAVLA